MTAKVKPVDAASDIRAAGPTESQVEIVKTRSGPHAPGLLRDDIVGLFLCSAGLPVEANATALTLHGLPVQTGPAALAPLIAFLQADEDLRGLLEPRVRLHLRLLLADRRISGGLDPRFLGAGGPRRQCGPRGLAVRCVGREGGAA